MGQIADNKASKNFFARAMKRWKKLLVYGISAIVLVALAEHFFRIGMVIRAIPNIYKCKNARLDIDKTKTFNRALKDNIFIKEMHWDSHNWWSPTVYFECSGEAILKTIKKNNYGIPYGVPHYLREMASILNAIYGRASFGIKDGVNCSCSVWTSPEKIIKSCESHEPLVNTYDFKHGLNEIRETYEVLTLKKNGFSLEVFRSRLGLRSAEQIGRQRAAESEYFDKFMSEISDRATDLLFGRSSLELEAQHAWLYGVDDILDIDAAKPLEEAVKDNPYIKEMEQLPQEEVNGKKCVVIRCHCTGDTILENGGVLANYFGDVRDTWISAAILEETTLIYYFSDPEKNGGEFKLIKTEVRASISKAGDSHVAEKLKERGVGASDIKSWLDDMEYKERYAKDYDYEYRSRVEDFVISKSYFRNREEAELAWLYGVDVNGCKNARFGIDKTKTFEQALKDNPLIKETLWIPIYLDGKRCVSVSCFGSGGEALKKIKKAGGLNNSDIDDNLDKICAPCVSYIFSVPRKKDGEFKLIDVIVGAELKVSPLESQLEWIYHPEKF
ncbi:MAG: hypothetical protein IKO42_01155 [Opitutales bacterium]|nr:hypothetical protein [Opitutales bacterium]